MSLFFGLIPDSAVEADPARARRERSVVLAQPLDRDDVERPLVRGGEDDGCSGAGQCRPAKQL